jgi:hypothetical protein
MAVFLPSDGGGNNFEGGCREFGGVLAVHGLIIGASASIAETLLDNDKLHAE